MRKMKKRTLVPVVTLAVILSGCSHYDSMDAGEVASMAYQDYQILTEAKMPPPLGTEELSVETLTLAKEKGVELVLFPIDGGFCVEATKNDETTNASSISPTTRSGKAVSKAGFCDEGFKKDNAYQLNDSLFTNKQLALEGGQ